MSIKVKLKVICKRYKQRMETSRNQDWGDKKTGFQLCVLGMAVVPSALMPVWATVLLFVGVALILRSSP